jgi:lipid II isoglutaminyl synthase (glutamine-hydrolysing)
MTENSSRCEIKICHLYHDLLNLYGDKGNIIALTKRCEWRGINVSISNITLGDDFKPSDHDIVFLGGGQDYEQEIIQGDLLKNRSGPVKEAIEHGTVFLCICGGYQLLGKYYRTSSGKEIEALDILDIWTESGRGRMIGNLIFKCDVLRSHSDSQDFHDGSVVGFENHSGRTFLGSGVKPLGLVIKGGGNNGIDKTEGAIYKNVYCSYSHGSLLPKNPHLADHIIETALRRKYSQFESLSKIDNSLEIMAHNRMARIKGV